MTTSRKIGIILIIIGCCLPTATLPFITEFHPQPDICLTSNFLGNLGNMVVMFGSKGMERNADMFTVIPYRYLFSAGVILICLGLSVIVLSIGRHPASDN